MKGSTSAPKETSIDILLSKNQDLHEYCTPVNRGVGTGPADPAAARPKFALSIKIETHNSKKF